ncbi:MAG: DUF2207 domain-containing protein [Candidatus Electrothrix sp. AUS4]|nr:DUF2207 domain-containing protein [Candidatus Electrothrix sp. AUS4]
MKCLRQLLTVYVQATVVVLFLLNAQTASAKSPPFYWEFINVLIDVRENGDMLITETQKYVFTGPHTNERYRYIPLDKVDGIDQIEVFEGEEKLAAETNVKNGQRWIKWRHELNPPESHTFVLKYRVKGGIQIHGEEDWVFVKAIFKGRSAPIESGNVTVRLPDSLVGKISSFKSFGVSAEARQVDDQTVEFVAKDAMPPGKELEVRVVVPHGILEIQMPHRQHSYLANQAKENTVQEASQEGHGKGFGALIIFIVILAFVAVLVTIFGDGGGRGGSSGSGYSETNYYAGGGFDGGGSGGGGGGCCGGGGG